MKALMIDIETLSLKPTAHVVQVGYCGADLTTGEMLIPPTNLWLREEPNGAIDLDTVHWWMQQSDAARTSVFKPPEGGYVSVGGVFQALHNAYETLNGGAQKPTATVWASPSAYDLPILTSMWARLGITLAGGREHKPWPYYMERDLMTLYKMLDPDKKLKPTNPLEHDAASDAKAQMDHLIAIFRNNPVLQGAK